MSNLVISRVDSMVNNTIRLLYVQEAVDTSIHERRATVRSERVVSCLINIMYLQSPYAREKAILTFVQTLATRVRNRIDYVPYNSDETSVKKFISKVLRTRGLTTS